MENFALLRSTLARYEVSEPKKVLICMYLKLGSDRIRQLPQLLFLFPLSISCLGDMLLNHKCSAAAPSALPELALTP